MKRGFLNDGRYKKATDEAYASAPSPGAKPPGQGGFPSSAAGDAPQDNNGAGDQDKMDVEMEDAQNESPEGHVREVEMNTSKGCDGVDSDETMNESPARAKDPKGKGKAKADVDDEDDVIVPDWDSMVIPPRPPPHRPGWGRRPEEAFFHRVPESFRDPHVKRAVFRMWPRDPNGKVLMPPADGRGRGKFSPDGYPWFETLYDVYHVNRVPSVLNAVSTVNGSALCEHIKALGELGAAAAEIEWAESEGRPRVEAVANTGELVECMESRVRLATRFNFRVHDDTEMEEDHKEKNEQDEDDEGAPGKANDIPPATEIPVPSPFHPSHYPKSWPVIPFEKTFPVLLQERIPLYLLPKTLYVHDPFNLLTACEQEFRDTSWTSRPDIVRTYNLRLSSTVGSQVEEAKRKAEELEEFKARTLIVLRYQRTEEQIKNYEPVIEVPLPLYIRRPTNVEESHLYLSPVAKVGEGHHSIVYKGEWELPRDIFMRPKICPTCFKESTDKEIQRLKDTGRWEKMMKACSWGPKGYTGCGASPVDLGAVNDPPKLENDGEIIEREITCVVPPGTAPSQVVELLEDIWDKFKKQNEAKSLLVYVGPDPVEKDPEVPFIRINPSIPYVSQKPCTHNASALPGRDGLVPRTAKFTVVVKLSLEDDPHLSREARNYQQFPDHLFNHYNGYIIVTQLKTTVPINAVVPQFYGHYKPERGETPKPGEPSYLSAILLLEHCGTPVEPQELSLEDQEECASLILRFQRAGWLHESIAPRNFLVQNGKPTEFPVMRRANPEPSFRLIDFGRARKYTTATEKQGEELEAIRMFGRLAGNMAITLSMGPLAE